MEHGEIVKMVLQFLKEQGYDQAFQVLQDESGLRFEEGSTSNELLATLAQFQEMKLALQPLDARRAEEEDELLVAGNDNHVTTCQETISDLHQSSILAVRFGPTNDTKLLATAAADKSVRVINYETKETVANFPLVHRGGVIALDWHPTQHNLLLTGSMDSTVKLLDTTTKRELQEFAENQRYVVRTRFSPDGRLFATASYDKTVRIYTSDQPVGAAAASASASASAPTYRLLHTLPFSGQVEAVVFTPDGEQLIVSVRGDNYLHYIPLDDPTSTTNRTRVNMNSFGDDHVSFTAMELAIGGPDQKYVLAATDKDRIIMFRLGTPYQARNFYGMTNDGFSQPRVAWEPSGRYLYTTSQDNKVYVYDVGQGKVAQKLAGHSSVVRDIHRHPSRDILATASFDKTVKLWTP